MMELCILKGSSSCSVNHAYGCSISDEIMRVLSGLISKELCLKAPISCLAGRTDFYGLNLIIESRLCRL